MINIEQISNKDTRNIQLAQELMSELTQNTEENYVLESERITHDLSRYADKLIQLVAKKDDNIVGLLNVQLSFAFFANGEYGIINELYVKPEYRKDGVGKLLIDAVLKIGEEKKWKRIDVTAPRGDEWKKTVHFYEKNGFVFAGPKLKYLF
ncbi:MAG: GNAT family N-acetyltransferase [Bacteroidales bacterium]